MIRLLTLAGLLAALAIVGVVLEGTRVLPWEATAPPLPTTRRPVAPEARLVGSAPPPPAAPSGSARGIGVVEGFVWRDGRRTSAEVTVTWVLDESAARAACRAGRFEERSSDDGAWGPDLLLGVLGLPVDGATSGSAAAGFSLPVTRPGLHVLAVGSADGPRLLAPCFVEPLARSTRRDLTVPQGPYELRVSVQDAHGRPLPALLGVLVREADGVPRLVGPWAAAAPGSLRLRGLPRGTARLVASLPDGRVLQSAPIEIPREEAWSFVVPAGGEAVHGLVLDARTRLPVAGARVVLTTASPDGTVLRATTTASDSGRFAAASLALDDEPWLLVHASRYVPFRGEAEVRPQDDPFVVELAPCVSVDGRVVDASGAPVPGVVVWIAARGPDLDDRLSDWRSTASDAQGRYTASDIEEGLLVVFALGGGHASVGLARTGAIDLSAFAVLAGRDGLGGHDLVVEPAAVLEGRVEDADGQPLAGWPVTVSPPEDREEGPPALYEVRGATSGADGGFQVADLVPDRCYEATTRDDESVAVLRSGTNGPLVLVADDGADRPRGGPGTRSIEVVDALTRSPVASATVEVGPTDAVDAVLEGVPYDEFRVGSDGRLVLDGVPPVALDVSVSAPGYLETEGAIAAEAATLTVALVPGQTIRGRVLLAEGAGPYRCWIDLDKADKDGDGWAWSRPDGTFEVTGLAEGPWSLDAGGSVGDVDVHSPRAVRACAGDEGVLVLVVPEEAKPPSGRVVLRGPDGCEVRYLRARTWHGGSEGLWSEHGADYGPKPDTDGTWWLEVFAAPGCGARLFGPLAPAVPGQDVELSLGPPLAVRGRVVDAGGAAVAGVWVTALPEFEGLAEGGSSQRDHPHHAAAVSDASGTFVLDGLGPYRYRVEVAAGGVRSSEGGPTVEAGAVGVLLSVARPRETEVVVVDPEGRPVAGASVRVRVRDEDDSCLASREVQADLQGRAWLCDVPTAAVLELTAWGGRGLLGRTLRPWDGRAARIVLPRSAPVLGRVVDRSGRPVRHARVEATIASWGDPAPRTSYDWTGSDGCFRLGDLAAGAGRLRVEFRGEELLAQGLSAPVEDLLLVIDPGPALTVTCRLPAASSASDVAWALHGCGGPVADGRTPAGQPLVAFGLDPAERYVLHAASAGPGGEPLVALACDLVVRDEPWVVPLVPALQAYVEVRGLPEGVLPKDVHVQATGEGITWRTRPQGDGVFTLEGLPPGDLSFEVYVWGWGRDSYVTGSTRLRAGDHVVVIPD